MIYKQRRLFYLFVNVNNESFGSRGSVIHFRRALLRYVRLIIIVILYYVRWQHKKSEKNTQSTEE